MLELSLLGPFVASWAGRPLGIGTAAARVVLAVLALEPGRTRSRGELARMLWPEQPQTVASTNLRQVVARLRRALPDPDAAVEVSRDALALSWSVRSDVAEFSALLAACAGHEHPGPARCPDCALRRGRAATLYRGEFGADIDPGGSPPVEDWLLLARERWQRQAVTVLHDLGADQAAAGAHEAALATAERTLDLEPWREEAHRQAMAALAGLGDQRGALERYRRCVAVLDAELGVAPDPGTVALRDRIAAGAARPVPAPTAAPGNPWAVPLAAQVAAHVSGPASLVGRDTEWETLQTARKAAAQAGRVVLVSGEPGIGKTRLTSALARSAFDDGAVALYGRCDEDLGVPYQPWVQALGHLVESAGDEVRAALGPQRLADLARLVPGALDPVSAGRRPLDADTDRYLLFQSVIALLAAVGAARPVVLVLDDLHWSDKPTLLLLRHVVAAAAQLPLLILGTYRDSDLSGEHPLTAVLAGLYRDAGVARMRLHGLADAGIRDLMESLAGHPLDEEGVRLGRAIRRETDGNPFFTVEILRHLAESQIIRRDDDGRWLVTDPAGVPSLPESVRAVVGQRVANLGPEVHRCLSAASVVGREFGLGLLAAVLERAEDDVLDLLDVAVAAAVVEEIPGHADWYTFTHALVQHTLHDDLGAARRRRLHRRVAEALEREVGDDPGDRAAELATHWLAAIATVEAGKALRYARLAGRSALARLAPDEAVRWFTHAVTLVPDVPDAARADYVELLIELGTAQRQAAVAEYRETLLEAAALARRLQRTDQLVAAALANNRGYWSSVGELDPERVAVLRAALDALPERDGPDRARLLATLAAELTFSGDWETRRSLAEQAVTMTRRIGDPVSRAHVLNLTFSATNVPETLADRLGRTAEAEDLAATSDDPATGFWAATFRAYAAVQAGDLPEVDRALLRAEVLAQRLSQPLLRYWATVNASWRTLLAGRTDDADDLARQAYELAVESGIPDGLTNFAAQRRVVRLHRGRLDEVVDQTEEMVRQNPGMPGLRAVLATDYCELDRDQQARALLSAELATGFSGVPYDPLWLNTWYRWGQVCAHLGERCAAEPLYRRLAPWSDQIVFIHVNVNGPVSHVLGRLAVLLGRTDDAHHHFARAATACAQLQSPYLTACNDLAWGELRGTPELVQRAVATADHHGYATLGRRSRDLLSELDRSSM